MGDATILNTVFSSAGAESRGAAGLSSIPAPTLARWASIAGERTRPSVPRQIDAA